MAALVVCIAGQLLFNAFLSRRTAETQRLRKPVQQLAQLKSEGDKFQKRKTELSDACKKLQTDLDRYQQVRRDNNGGWRRCWACWPGGRRHKRSSARSTATKTKSCCTDCASTCGRPTPLAGGLAEDLGEVLGPQGWQVQLPSKHSQEVLAAGGPWEFEIRIQDPEAQQPEPSNRPRPLAPPSGPAPGEETMKLTDREKLLLLVAPVAIILAGYASWFNLFQRAKLQAVTSAYQAAVDEFGKIGPYDAANAARQIGT